MFKPLPLAFVFAGAAFAAQAADEKQLVTDAILARRPRVPLAG